MTDTLDLLTKLTRLCKASVNISVNEHRDYYMSVTEHLKDLGPEPIEVEPDILQKMIETDTVVELHFYPITPVSFYLTFHYDIRLALEEALAELEKDGII